MTAVLAAFKVPFTHFEIPLEMIVIATCRIRICACLTTRYCAASRRLNEGEMASAAANTSAASFTASP